MSETSPSDADAVLRIDLDALRENYRLIRQAVPGAEVAAVVKADGYGLGLVPVAKALAQAGCEAFFVAQNFEGASLRAALPGARIFVLHGAHRGMEESFLVQRLIPILNTAQEIRSWQRCARKMGRTLPVGLHLDTGMNRLGLSEAEYRALLQEGDTFAGLDIVHVMSHLACADTPQNEMNRRQLQRFTTWRRDFPTARASLANSAASLTHADYHFDMVRVGIALYGGNPFTHLPNPMRPVATLRARLLQCRNVKPYETIGYGATYTAPGDIVIATAGIGYGDGYPRVLGNKGLGYLETGYARLVGRVSMDSITLDVSALPREVYAPGRWVELMGPHVGVDAMASLSGTISYDILTGFTARVAREYVTAQQDSAENGGGQ